ncbi:MAG: DUF6677 family protein [Phycisphaerae bacterium]
MPAKRKNLPPAVVAVAGWLLPGLAHWLIGRRVRGYVIGATVLGIFLVGLLVAGVRVIQVPGYDFNGRRQYVAVGHSANGQPLQQWQLTASPFAAVISKPWYIGQVLAGPVTVLTSWASLEIADNWRVDGTDVATGNAVSLQVEAANADLAADAAAGRGVQATAITEAWPRTHSPLSGVGTIYTAVAGMLNLLAIIDATGRAARGNAAEPEHWADEADEADEPDEPDEADEAEVTAPDSAPTLAPDQRPA